MTHTRLILEIIIPITSVVVFMLLIFLFFLVRKLYRRHHRDQIIKSLYEEVSMAKLDMYNAQVSKVGVMANTNAKYESIYERLKVLYDQIEDYHGIANKVLYELNNGGSEHINKYKMSKKDFGFKISEIREEIDAIRSVEADFEIISNEVIYQDESLNSEFTHFRNNARKVTTIYQNKRLLLDKVSSKIDELISELKQLENDFNKHVSAGDMKVAGEVLRKYSKLVIKLAEVINEGPQIQMYLDEIIKKAIVAIVQNFNSRQTELAGSVNIINFNDSIKAIAQQFEYAKSEYSKLHINEAREGIRKILRSIKALENIINFEIRSKNVVTEFFKAINTEVKIALERYVEIKKQFRILISKVSKIPLELNDAFLQLRSLAKNIDDKAMNFAQAIADKNLAFSSKLERSKTLVKLTVDFTVKLNEIMQLLWSINIESSILRNKFKQAEAAINEILANTKRQNIMISKEQKSHLDDIVSRMDSIAQKLQSESVSKETSKEVNQLVASAIMLYKSLSSSIQIAEMSANVIREFSPQRALNEKINLALQHSEKLYLEGNYAESLNTLLVEIEGVK